MKFHFHNQGHTRHGIPGIVPTSIPGIPGIPGIPVRSSVPILPQVVPRNLYRESIYTVYLLYIFIYIYWYTEIQCT
jgi:hypothetical protein